MPRGVISIRSTSARIQEVPGPQRYPWTSARTTGELTLDDFEDSQVIPTSIILADLSDGIVDGATGAVMDGEGRMITELCTYSRRAPVDQPWDHPAFFRLKSCSQEDVTGDVVLLSNPNAHVYFHWLLEIFPRLGLLRDGGFLTDNFKCLVPAKQGFFGDSLRMAGISAARLIILQPGVRYKVERLITTSDIFPQGMIATFAPYLRSIFLPVTKRARSDRLIYISRKVAGLRPVLNEDALIDIIKEFGGEIVVLEGKSMRDQAELLDSATCVVTPHGSGLSNLVFCRPGTKILELFAGAYVRKLYPWIGTALQLNYWYLIGSQTVDGEGNSLYAAIQIEPDRFREALRVMLKSTSLEDEARSAQQPDSTNRDFKEIS